MATTTKKKAAKKVAKKSANKALKKVLGSRWDAKKADPAGDVRRAVERALADPCANPSKKRKHVEPNNVHETASPVTDFEHAKALAIGSGRINFRMLEHAMDVSEVRAKELIQELMDAKVIGEETTAGGGTRFHVVFEAAQKAESIETRDVTCHDSEAVEEPVTPPAPAKLPAGVHLSIAIASSIGSCTSTGVVLLRNNPVADPGVDPAAPAAAELDKPGILMVANSEFTAASRCFIHERQAANEKALITRVPAELTKIGKTSKTIKFASGGSETLFGRERVWVADSDDSQTAKIYNPLQEVPALPPAAFKELCGDELIIEIPLNVLLKVAEAVNGVSNQDGSKVRIAIPNELDEITLVSVLGSDGVGMITCTLPSSADAVEHVKKFNQTVIDMKMMFEQLPESLRKHEKTQEDEDGSLSKAYVAPGESAASKTDEPWMAEWLQTPVNSLEISDSTRDMLKSQSKVTIGDLNAIQKAHPNTGLREIKGVGAGKADKINEAMLKVWYALKKKHESADDAGGAADTAAIAEETKTATAGIGGSH